MTEHKRQAEQIVRVCDAIAHFSDSRVTVHISRVIQQILFQLRQQRYRASVVFGSGECEKRPGCGMRLEMVANLLADVQRCQIFCRNQRTVTKQLRQRAIRALQLQKQIRFNRFDLRAAQMSDLLNMRDDLSGGTLFALKPGGNS